MVGFLAPLSTIRRKSEKCQAEFESISDYRFRADLLSADFLVLTMRLTLLISLLDFLEGDFEPEFVPDSRGINLLAIGDRSPVPASHPGPASNAPLLPAWMSLNAALALAA